MGAVTGAVQVSRCCSTWGSHYGTWGSPSHKKAGVSCVRHRRCWSQILVETTRGSPLPWLHAQQDIANHVFSPRQWQSCWSNVFERSLPRFERAMDETLDTFSVREWSVAPFMFCGKEVVQHEDFNITVTAKDKTEKIRPICIGDKRGSIDKRNAEETTCLRSVVAALAWVARKIRPGLSYRMSKFRSVASKVFVKDMRECNKF